jgi:selenocysteine-specific elongation factor
MPREQLRSMLGWTPAEWPAILERLVTDVVVREDGPLVAAPDHSAGLGGRRADADRFLAALREHRYSPPSGRELLDATGADLALIRALAEQGEIVRLSDGIYFDRDAYDEAVATVVALIRSEGEATVASARDAVGTSRKYMLALLEHLDSERITRRVGDARVLGSKTPTCG